MAWTKSICRLEKHCTRDTRAGATQAAATWFRTWVRSAGARQIAGFSNLVVLLLLLLASQGPSAGPALSIHASMLALPPEVLTVALIATSALTSLLLLAGYEQNAPVQNSETAAASTSSNAASTEMSNVLEQMGHDLRTPLNAIIGFSDIMQQQMHGPLGSDRYQDYAGHIRESGVALLATIECTLTLTQHLVERGTTDGSVLKQAD